MTSKPPPYAVPPEETYHGFYPQQPVPATVAGSPGYYPVSQQQQPPQMQQFAISPAPTTLVVAPPPRPVQSFVVHIVLSCCAFWFCGGLFGGIAFICASKSARDFRQCSSSRENR